MEFTSDEEEIRKQGMEILRTMMGEDGIAFLDLDTALESLKQEYTVWQAPFSIGLLGLTFLWNEEVDAEQKTFEYGEFDILLMASLMTAGGQIPDLFIEALEPIESHLALLLAKPDADWLGDDDSLLLFHLRLALGILLLIDGKEDQAKPHIDIAFRMTMLLRGKQEPYQIGFPKTAAAIMLKAVYLCKHDFHMALHVLWGSLLSVWDPRMRESLFSPIPELLESFINVSDNNTEFGDWFESWVDVFDGIGGMIVICADADTDAVLPSDCKITSPQFWAWTFGKLAAQFAHQFDAGWDTNEGFLPRGYIGEDWENGTIVGALEPVA